MGAAAPYLVNLKSNTMKNTPQIYSIISTTANNSWKNTTDLNIIHNFAAVINIRKHKFKVILLKK